MKVRNNTNRDFGLDFSYGDVLNMSRGEISRELTDKETTDIFFAKHIKARRITIVKERRSIIKTVVKEEVVEKVEKKKEKKDKKKKYHI